MNNKRLLISENSRVIFVLVAAVLFSLELENFLLFHLGVELFSIIIAASIFIIALNTISIAQNDYLIFLGLVYGFIGGIDLLHTITYKGMAVLEVGPNIPTQLWIAARYLESLCLVGSFFYLHHKLNTNRILLVLSGITLLLVVSIFAGYFPDCFVVGEGLTLFKKVSEYLISSFLVVGIWLLYRHQHRFDSRNYRFMMGALITTIIAEIAFTLYIGVYDLSNVVGHVFKLLSFYLIYKAVIEVTLKKPYASLFYDLNNKMAKIETQKQELEAKNKDLEESYIEIDSINEDLKSTQEKLITANEQLKQRIEAGKRFHLQFMGEEVPDLKEVSAAAYYLPAEEIGGDLYDFVKLDNKLIFYLVDITGHGIDGAFLNVFVKEAINNFLVANDHSEMDLLPQAMMKHINQRFREEKFPDDYFICLLLFAVDLETYQVNYVNSGFQSLPAVADGGEIVELTNGGPPISLSIPSETYKFTEETFYLKPGDTILAATDGLIEEKAAGNMYGQERVLNRFNDAKMLPTQIIIDQIVDDFCSFVELPQTDDITLLAVKREVVEEKVIVKLNPGSNQLQTIKQQVTNQLQDKINFLSELIAGLQEVIEIAMEDCTYNLANRKIELDIVLTEKYVKIEIKDERSNFNWKSCLETKMKPPEQEKGLQPVPEEIFDYISHNQQGNKAVLVKLRE